MSPQEFRDYTDALIALSHADERILGLVALGSMAGTHHQADEWSDHDFWLVVKEGTQPEFHADLSWIPSAERIVVAFKETDHGWKILFNKGHILEYAIFSLDELQLTRFQHYVVLVDKARVKQSMVAMVARGQHLIPSQPALYRVNQVLTLLVVGLGRYARGEEISASLFIKSYALEHLCYILRILVPPEHPHLVDDLSPTRRIELTLPAYRERLKGIITAPILDAAQVILDLLREVADDIADFPHDGVTTVQKTLLTITNR